MCKINRDTYADELGTVAHRKSILGQKIIICVIAVVTSILAPKVCRFSQSRLILKKGFGLKSDCFIVFIFNSFALLFVYLFRSGSPLCNVL